MIMKYLPLAFPNTELRQARRTVVLNQLIVVYW